jgi:hypothetical protein
MKKLTMEEMTLNTDDEKYRNLTNIDQRQQNDEIALKAITELLDIKKLKTISRVKFEQVAIIAKLYLYADTFSDNFTRKLADLLLQLQISTNGLGRKELVQMVQQRSDLFGLQEVKKTSKDIFR